MMHAAYPPSNPSVMQNEIKTLLPKRDECCIRGSTLVSIRKVTHFTNFSSLNNGFAGKQLLDARSLLQFRGGNPFFRIRKLTAKGFPL